VSTERRRIHPFVRTQVLLDVETRQALRLRAQLEHRSMSAVARDILREGFGAGERAGFSFISSGASGRKDISERHDEALEEDFSS
jgi:plasmid stability protein